MYSYDRAAGSGFLSWEDVNVLSKKHKGRLDKAYKSKSDAAQDTRWLFSDEDAMDEFRAVLDKKFMSYSTDRKTNSVIVRF